MQSEDLINQVLEEIESFNIDDIPNIDLYMDQVTTYLNGKFNTSKRHDDMLLARAVLSEYQHAHISRGN